MTEAGKGRGLKGILWPSQAPGPMRATIAVQFALGLLAVVVGLVEVLGLWKVSGDIFEGLILFAVGLVLLTFLADAGDRSASREEQRELVDAARAATGQLEVREVRSHEIGEGLRRLLKESNEWTFRGGSGRYLRNATLPVLARIHDRDVNVDIQILDPRDQALCKEYAEYRSRYRGDSIRRPDEGKVETITTDLLSVVFAAVWYSTNSRIRARVLLLKSFSPLRYDIGSTGLYLTLPDPREPALFAASGSWYYVSVLDEMRQSVHGHPSLVLPADSKLVGLRKDQVDAGVVKAGLEKTFAVDPFSGNQTALLDGATLSSTLDFSAIAKRVFLEDPPY